MKVSLIPDNANSEMPAATVGSDPSGDIDWGLVQFGEYSLRATYKVDEYSFSKRKTISVMPGRDKSETVQFDRPTSRPIKTNLVLPSDAKFDRELTTRIWAVALLQSVPPGKGSRGLDWSLDVEKLFWLCVGPRGEHFVHPIGDSASGSLEIEVSKLAGLSDDPIGRFTQRAWKIPSSKTSSESLPMGRYNVFDLWCAVEYEPAHALILDPVVFEDFHPHDVDKVRHPRRLLFSESSYIKERGYVIQRRDERFEGERRERHHPQASFRASETMKIRIPASEVEYWNLTRTSPDGVRYVGISGFLDNLCRDIWDKGLSICMFTGQSTLNQTNLHIHSLSKMYWSMNS